MTAARWLEEAHHHHGLRETAGPLSNPELETMWRSLPGGAWYWDHFGRDDSKLPWCGAFMAYVMKACGIVFPKRYASAAEWLFWGVALDAPTVGCLVIFKRPGGAHVAIVIGRNAHGQILCIGGNQRDSVCVLAFDEERVDGYRWPPDEPLPALARLPTLAATAATSRNEA